MNRTIYAAKGGVKVCNCVGPENCDDVNCKLVQEFKRQGKVRT